MTVDLNKSLYKALILAYDVLGLEEDQELCRKIKNIRYSSISQKDKDKTQEILRLLVDKMESTDYDAAAEKERLLLLFK